MKEAIESNFAVMTEKLVMQTPEFELLRSLFLDGGNDKVSEKKIVSILKA